MNALIYTFILCSANGKCLPPEEPVASIVRFESAKSCLEALPLQNAGYTLPGDNRLYIPGTAMWWTCANRADSKWTPVTP